MYPTRNVLTRSGTHHPRALPVKTACTVRAAASRDGRVIDLRLLAPRRGERAIEPSRALALGRLSGHASFIPECRLPGVSSLSSGEVHSCVSALGMQPPAIIHEK